MHYFFTEGCLRIYSYPALQDNIFTLAMRNVSRNASNKQ
jgi:hypothetical protein